MKKLFFFFLVTPFLAFSQMINNFDSAPADTNYWLWFSNQGGQHYGVATNATPDKGYIKLSYNTDTLSQGTGALKIDYSVHNSEGYGGYTKLEHWNPDSNGVYDWSKYDSIRFSYYVSAAQSIPSRVTFRLALMDVSNSSNNYKDYKVSLTEYYYSFESILDNTPGWHVHQLALLNDHGNRVGTAFDRTGWNGIKGNDILDKDKIKGFSIEFSISGTGDGDYSAGTIFLDDFTLFGKAKTPFVFFTGRDFATGVSQYTWGGSSLEIAQGIGPDEGKNSLKWTQANGSPGIGLNFNPRLEMANVWESDTMKFKMKAEEGVGTMRIQLQEPKGSRGVDFDPIADNLWHQYNIKLSDLPLRPGVTSFDPDSINVMNLRAENTGVAGKVVYISDWWTGNPNIDVIPPKAPQNVNGVPGQYYDLIVWDDVPNEKGEVYTVYSSEAPITNLDAPGVEIIANKVAEGTQTANHLLFYPLKDNPTRYYYAVKATDSFGNVGPFNASAAVDNTALGIPTISLTPPADFAADGDLQEWVNSGIRPFVLKPSTSNISQGVFTDDADMTGTLYLAIDDKYLYFAGHMVDDVYDYDSTVSNYYENDIIQFYIGLYNMSARHNGIKRGAEPDYKFNLQQPKVDADVSGVKTPIYAANTSNYYFAQEMLSNNWNTEMKVSLDSLLMAANASGDTRFHPKRGQQIVMDFCINDSDVPRKRDGILTFSTLTKDQSYLGPEYWAVTWMGDTNKVATGIEDESGLNPTEFQLSQNYPNPFNPETTIRYTLSKNVPVSVKIFDIIGREVATLVNQNQVAGYYTVRFNASNLTSGVYFYQIQAGEFTQVRKMLLVK